MYRLVWFGLKMKQTQFERKTKCSSKETCFGANDDDDSSKYTEELVVILYFYLKEL